MSLARFMHTHTHTHFFPLAKQHKTTFHYHSARVKVSNLARHLWRLDYSGVMGHEAFIQLRAQAVEATQEAHALQIHVERALITTDLMPQPGRDIYRHNMAPAAVVVRPDQFELWLAYARAMERIGITRMIFLETQQHLAQRFLDCLVGAQNLVEQQWRAGK